MTTPLPIPSIELAMPIIQYLHTALLVTDLEKAEHFYGNILGLSKVERSLKYPGAWYQLGDIQVHLIVDRNLDKELQNPEKWGRNPHLAFGVADLDEVKSQLLASGCEVQMSASGRAALFTQDPDNNVIELSQV
jgi:catechol 2,3-dioxygenase-like lactoylglutathione lyase family enzyme